jgi:glutamine---fructose-6-phosphate transaminase (isomerizing)
VFKQSTLFPFLSCIFFFFTGDPKQVMYLQDFDLVHIQNGSVSIFNIASFLQKKISSQLPQTREFITIDEEIETIMRGSYDSFMQKEIFEQPESIKTTMRGRVRAKEHAVRLGGIAEHVRDVESSRRVVMLACGTSYHTALATQQMLEELTGLPVFVDLASEFVDRSPNVYRDDLFIFISQSGETSDTLKAVKYVKRRGALVCGITNTVGSAIARETHFGIHVNAGVEIGVASTKAYTCQIICVVMFALVMSADSSKRAERRIEIMDGLRDLPDLITETLKCESQIEKLSQDLIGCKSILVIGRGYHFSTALEGALKIKEISYVHSEGISASELKHGPIALVDESIPVILICTQDALYKEVFSALEQLSARHGNIICICNKGDEEVHKKATVVIEVPKTVDCLQCVLNVIPLQLMSYHLAKALGRNVDRPRNLAKSVVV